MAMFERIAENAIAEAMRGGQVRQPAERRPPTRSSRLLQGARDMRAAYGVLKSANVLPEEIELLNEISRLDRAMAAAPDPSKASPTATSAKLSASAGYPPRAKR